MFNLKQTHFKDSLWSHRQTARNEKKFKFVGCDSLTVTYSKTAGEQQNQVGLEDARRCNQPGVQPDLF